MGKFSSKSSLQENIVTREQWLRARRALLAEERELTRRRDRLNERRRALPWVRVEQSYRFDTPDGPRALADLFQGRGQLLVQHFMLAPESEHICNGCALMADHVDAARRHFEQADLSFVAVSRAPLARIEAVRRRLGWNFLWVSSQDSRFNYDYRVSFTDRQIAAGETDYNYGTTPYASRDLPGVSVFVSNGAGDVFHSYSAYSRGCETLIGAFQFLDLTPLGRNEEGTMSWVRLHDEYPATA